jgi:hypothetical protein
MAGTYNGKGVSRGILAGEGGIGGYRGRHQSTRQSKLAKSVGPPAKWPLVKPFLYGIVGMFCLPFVRLSHNAWNALFVAYCTVVVLYLATALFYNLGRRPEKLREWESSFMCQRCGAIIGPQASAASQG